MTTEEVYRDIEQTLGMVPEFMRTIPEDSAEHIWVLFKRTQLAPSPVPQKYRQLIGVCVAAATRCRYCTLFHTEMARLEGATDEEIREALFFAGESAAWSTMLNGAQVDYEAFRRDVQQVADIARSRRQQGQAPEAPQPGMH